MAQEPLSPNTQQAYRNTLDVNSSPAFIDTSLAPQPVAVVGLPLREVKFATASVSGSGTSTVLTGSGRGQWITGFVLSAESSASTSFAINIRGSTAVTCKIALNTSVTVPMDLTTPWFLNAGDVLSITSNSASQNLSGSVFYFDK